MDELTIGQKFISSKKFDKEMVLAYAKLTGDYNPIHFDKEYALKTIFLKPIVHGPLVLTFVTTLFANQFPGIGTVYLSHNIEFRAPVFYDDEVTAVLEVIKINSKNHIFMQTTCTNQNGVLILDGVARLKKY